ncbi:micronuclear linker histone polyprotein-like isoform X1 [Clytia hemisphaerica]|uniref:Uncharacterized protein n=1 Tax=Clytia hemisphaerica TaxID=252671 RepID=A0A7M5WIR5_9CNID
MGPPMSPANFEQDFIKQCLHEEKKCTNCGKIFTVESPNHTPVRKTLSSGTYYGTYTRSVDRDGSKDTVSESEVSDTDWSCNRGRCSYLVKYSVNGVFKGQTRFSYNSVGFDDGASSLRQSSVTSIGSSFGAFEEEASSVEENYGRHDDAFEDAKDNGGDDHHDERDNTTYQRSLSPQFEGQDKSDEPEVNEFHGEKQKTSRKERCRENTLRSQRTNEKKVEEVAVNENLNPEILKNREIENKGRTDSPLSHVRNESPATGDSEKNHPTISTKRNNSASKKQPAFNDFRLSTARKTSSKIQQKLSMFASTDEKEKARKNSVKGLKQLQEDEIRQGSTFANLPDSKRKRIQQQLLDSMFRYAEKKYSGRKQTTSRSRNPTASGKEDSSETPERDYGLYLKSLKTQMNYANDKVATIRKQKQEIERQLAEAEQECKSHKKNYEEAVEEHENAIKEGREIEPPADFTSPTRKHSTDRMRRKLSEDLKDEVLTITRDCIANKSDQPTQKQELNQDFATNANETNEIVIPSGHHLDNKDDDTTYQPITTLSDDHVTNNDDGYENHLPQPSATRRKRRLRNRRYAEEQSV